MFGFDPAARARHVSARAERAPRGRRLLAGRHRDGQRVRRPLPHEGARRSSTSAVGIVQRLERGAARRLQLLPADPRLRQHLARAPEPAAAPAARRRPHRCSRSIEGVRRRALAREVYERVSVVGFALILLIFFIALTNDVGALPPTARLAADGQRAPDHGRRRRDRRRSARRRPVDDADEDARRRGDDRADRRARLRRLRDRARRRAEDRGRRGAAAASSGSRRSR